MAYVNNKELMDCLLECHAVGYLTPLAYQQFDLIIKQRLYYYNQKSYMIEYEEMQCHCMDKVERVWKNFKFDKDNAFAYFVSVIDNVIKAYFSVHTIKFVSLDSSVEL